MSNEGNGGISFIGALFLLFLGLKLGKVIDWSWWWVFSPFWIAIVIFIVVLLIYGISVFIGEKIRLYNSRKRWQRKMK